MPDNTTRTPKKSSGPHHRCDASSCLRPVEKSQLRQCSGCRKTRYCSRDCQRKEWPRHKATCMSMARAYQQLNQPENQHFKVEVEMLSKWVDTWATTIGYYGLKGMDLKNNPDAPMTQAIFIDVKLRDPRPTDRLRLFQIRTGCVLPREEIPAMLKLNYKNTPPPDKETFIPATDPSTPLPLLITAICNGVFHAFNMDATVLAGDIMSGIDLLFVPETTPATWVVPLAARVDNGKPEGVRGY